MSVITSFKQPTDQQQVSSGPVVGQIVAFDSSGQALVDYPGLADGPCVARSTLPDHRAVVGVPLPVPVLLMFENNNPSKPIIIGLINDTPFPLDSASHNFAAEKGRDVYIDGKKMVFTAKDEILLKCGKSSILLRRDGKVVIKGENLISRSSMSNKIKGSSVSIN